MKGKLAVGYLKVLALALGQALAVSLAIFSVEWLVVEAGAHFLEKQYAALPVGRPLQLVGALVIAIVGGLFARPPSLSGKIEPVGASDPLLVRVVDIFDAGAHTIVIPINRQFVVDAGGSVATAASVTGELVRRYYSADATALQRAVDTELAAGAERLADYPVGHCVALKGAGHSFLFLATASLNDAGHSKSDYGTFQASVEGLWNYVGSGRVGKNSLAVPLIGTGHGRLPISLEHSAMHVVLSYLDATASSSPCDGVTVCVHPVACASKGFNIREVVGFGRTYAAFRRGALAAKAA